MDVAVAAVVSGAQEKEVWELLLLAGCLCNKVQSAVQPVIIAPAVLVVVVDAVAEVATVVVVEVQN